MLLRIAGINHFDVLGRHKLRDWLTRYSHEVEGPAFLATEWDQNIFETVRGQRQHCRRLAAQRWPNFSDELLDIVMMSLGYEADTHADLYPNIEILWLDQGREADERDVNRYAEDRIHLYETLLAEGEELRDQQEVLAGMSNAASRRAGGDGGIGVRDQNFARRILDRADDDGWAIVIVGKNHTADVEGSMRRLLEQGEQRCEVVLL
jgi:hypothetical protein